jgi:hypothetical protein
MTRKTSSYTRNRQRQTPWQRERHKSVNPVKEAVMLTLINTDIERLRTGVDLQAWAGSNAPALVNLCGRLIYVVCHAARHHGLGESADARILASTANALADLAKRPTSLEQQRASIQGGLLAIDRMLPHLNTWSLAAGALELDGLLQRTEGMGTADVHKALGWTA